MIKQGDTIGIIALAGACDKQQVQQAVQNIEALGFKVKLSKNIYDKDKKYNYRYQKYRKLTKDELQQYKELYTKEF